MVRTHTRRTPLFLGAAGIAMATALATPSQVFAQAAPTGGAFQASPEIIAGNVVIDRGTPNVDTITVASPTAVIDWFPTEDAAGNALTFLPAGATAIFQDSPGQGGFAILNRILPSTNGNIVVFDGTVISRLQDASGNFSSGGLVAFYSPTGILVGSTAAFDVGQLLLTTLDPDLASFDSFAAGGTLSLFGSPGATAGVTVASGASIVATGEGSFFAVAAPQITMSGAAYINGSTAYVAGEQVNLTYSNGLFDIQIPVGTSVANAIVHDGATGGPSSGGAGDEHVIYGVAKAETNPISLLFQGNLGFDTAAVAGVENGDIILAANYDVFGKIVASTNADFGSSVAFVGNDETSTVQADIFVDALTASSDFLAAGSHTTQVAASSAGSSFAGDLVILGRQSAQVVASGADLNVAGDLLIAATRYGEVNTGSVGLDAVAGNAALTVTSGGSITVDGSARVDASASAGVDNSTQTGGSATGGLAQVNVDNGSLQLNGGLSVDAGASFFQGVGQTTGGPIAGGSAVVTSGVGGSIAVTGTTTVSAAASGADVSAGTSSGTQADAGEIQVIANGGGTMDFNGDVTLINDATAGAGGGTGVGASGIGGGTFLLVDSSGGAINITGSATLISSGMGGTMANGTGGDGVGGGARVVANGGTIDIDGGVFVDAGGTGGNGANGGNGFGGMAGAIAEDFIGAGTSGAIAIGGSFHSSSQGWGGDAIAAGGRGGDGRGGNSFLQATGSGTVLGSVSVAGTALVDASGVGGTGGAGDAAAGVLPGRGGDGFGGSQATVNQHDSNFANGAFILAGRDNGSISVGGLSQAYATGIGGTGGAGDTGQTGGDGGNGTGGDAYVGLLTLGGDGTVNLGTMNLADVTFGAFGFGGDGGISAITAAAGGTGGAGTGGTSILAAVGGTLVVGTVQSFASAWGGQGDSGGDAVGGTAASAAQAGGSIDAIALTTRATGEGGAGHAGNGGAGFGGDVLMELVDGSIATSGTAGATILDASAWGGTSVGGDGGLGMGGSAAIYNVTGTTGSVSLAGRTQLVANGMGGAVLSGGGTGGVGSGGLAQIDISSGTSLDINSLQVVSSGRGGNSADGEGGAGNGGSAEILATGSGTTINIVNTPDSTTFVADSVGGMISSYGIGGSTGGGSGIGGAGTGGSAQLTVSTGASVILPADPAQQLNRIFARGVGGASSVDGGTGGFGQGGAIDILVDNATLTAPNLLPSTFSRGGTVTGADATGGSARGGSRAIRFLNGSLVSISSPGGGSGAQGADGTGAGNGGDAEGGTALVVIDNSTVDVTGNFLAFTGAVGGAGRVGGDATGGSSDFSILNGSVVTVTPDANGFGVLGADGAGATGGQGTVEGGSATGGTGFFEIRNSTYTGGVAVGSVSTGGGATGTGTGGTAVGATATFVADNADLTLVGESEIISAAFGGSGGAIGGAALPGIAGIEIGNGSTVEIVANAAGEALLSGRNIATGGSGSSQGGNATSGFAELAVVDSSLSGRVVLESTATGGDSSDGTGGTADAGEARLDAFGSSVALGAQSEAFARAAGGAGVTGGNALGGVAVMTGELGSTFTVDPGSDGQSSLSIRSEAIGGEGQDQDGSANAGGGNGAGFGLFDGSSLSVDTLTVASTGKTGNGQATGGLAIILADLGSALTAGALTLDASALATGGTAIGGQVDLTANGADSLVSIGQATLNADGADGAGGFVINAVEGAVIDFGNVTATALGANGGAALGSLTALGGDITISGNGTFRTGGNLSVQTGQGGLIGGPSVASPTAMLLLEAAGDVVIIGDDDNRISFGGQELVIRSRELDILEGARIGAELVSLEVIGNDATTVLGGADEIAGYTLTQDEIARIEAGAANFSASNDGSASDDILIRDTVISGSLDDGPSSVEISSGGVIRVEGQLTYVDAAATDSLQIFADRLEIVTPGGIALVDPAGDPTGIFGFEGGDFWMADAETIGRLQDNVAFEGRDELLATAAEGSDDPLGYLRAGDVTIDVGTSALVRNTGTQEEPGGITVTGTLRFDDGDGIPIDVVAYGRKQNADGTFVTGADFFALVDFGLNPPDPGDTVAYVEGSSFNDCEIEGSDCGTGEREEVIELVDSAAPLAAVTTVAPVTAAPVEQSEQDSNVEFGAGFPGLLNAALLSQEDAIDDPVASGGDIALYGSGSAEDESKNENEDEDEDEDEGEGEEDGSDAQ